MTRLPLLVHRCLTERDPLSTRSHLHTPSIRDQFSSSAQYIRQHSERTTGHKAQSSTSRPLSQGNPSAPPSAPAGPVHSTIPLARLRVTRTSRTSRAQDVHHRLNSLIIQLSGSLPLQRSISALTPLTAHRLDHKQVQRVQGAPSLLAATLNTAPVLLWAQAVTDIIPSTPLGTASPPGLPGFAGAVGIGGRPLGSTGPALGRPAQRPARR